MNSGMEGPRRLGAANDDVRNQVGIFLNLIIALEHAVFWSEEHPCPGGPPTWGPIFAGPIAHDANVLVVKAAELKTACNLMTATDQKKFVNVVAAVANQVGKMQNLLQIFTVAAVEASQQGREDEIGWAALPFSMFFLTGGK